MKSSKNKFFIWAVVVLILAASGYLVFNYFSKLASLPEMGATYSSEGAAHVADGTKVGYKTNPPSSGAHYSQAANWGVYRAEVPDERIVHNLEHGGVWISYKPGIPEEEIKKLKELIENYRSKVILTPRAKNDSPIALVSWGRIYKTDAFDEAAIKNYILKYRNTGPEIVPD